MMRMPKVVLTIPPSCEISTELFPDNFISLVKRKAQKGDAFLYKKNSILFNCYSCLEFPW